ncbi:MAG: type II toxin-antitoxin system MqsA family antitoxin [Methanoculleus sp.]
MIPERCTFCKGTLHEGTAELIARVGDEIIVIRDVPALVCDRCGEAYYSAEVSQKIDAVMKDVHSGRLCCRPLAAGSAAGLSRQARSAGPPGGSVAFGPDTPSSSQSRLDAQRSALFSAHNPYGQPFSLRRPTVLQEGYLDDQRKDHQRTGLARRTGT